MTFYYVFDRAIFGVLPVYTRTGGGHDVARRILKFFFASRAAIPSYSGDGGAHKMKVATPISQKKPYYTVEHLSTSIENVINMRTNLRGGVLLLSASRSSSSSISS